MADKKISELTLLAQANIDSASDVLPIVDTSATETKKATPAGIVLKTITDNASATRTAAGLVIGTDVQAYDADTTKNDVANTFTTNQVISASTSDAALRITQTGAGNALLVEDSTNPDSTPFIVKADGKVGIGTTTPANFNGYLTAFGGVIESAADDSSGGFQGTRSSADSGSSNWFFNKSRGTNASKVIVNSGDSLGVLNWRGYDGAGNINAAAVAAEVDGTPGTNDMPGRLVFSTTADGASSPTERMRIDSAGQVTIGGTATAGQNVRVAKNITGSTTGRGVLVTSTVQSDVTSVAYGYSTFLGTQATSFTLVSLSHYHAQQGTIGATSTATNQYGFTADSSLTGATNNYGFYSNIASGTGRWNFYSAGTAANYFGGATTVSVNSSSDALRITQTGAGNALVVEDSTNPDSTPVVVDAEGRVIGGDTVSRVTSGSVSNIFQSSATTGRAGYSAFRWSNDTGSPSLNFAKSRSATAGSFSIVSNGDQIGTLTFQADDGTSFIQAAQIVAAVDGTPGTNDMPGRLVFSTTADGASSPTERMRIDSAGRFSLNQSAANTAVTFLVNTSSSAGATGATIRPILAQTIVPSSTTTDALNVRSFVGTAAASFTLPTMTHFSAGQGTFGAGSTVTNQYGFAADSTLTGATNNYGFWSNIASGTGRWNFYANGTAANAFSGDVKIFGAGGLGYATGSGGAVTQATSRTTGVTLDKTNGAITLVSAAGTTTWQTFTVTNNTVAATDTIIINQKSGTDLYEIHITAVAAGSFNVSYRTTGGTTTEQPVFNFAVIKAVAA